MLAITMTQGWMIGIIAFMAVFGICAGVFSALGKNKWSNLKSETGRKRESSSV